MTVNLNIFTYRGWTYTGNREENEKQISPVNQLLVSKRSLIQKYYQVNKHEAVARAFRQQTKTNQLLTQQNWFVSYSEQFEWFWLLCIFW